jgi:hypothetical protein
MEKEPRISIVPVKELSNSKYVKKCILNLLSLGFSLKIISKDVSLRFFRYGPILRSINLKISIIKQQDTWTHIIDRVKKLHRLIAIAYDMTDRNINNISEKYIIKVERDIHMQVTVKQVRRHSVRINWQTIHMTIYKMMSNFFLPTRSKA